MNSIRPIIYLCFLLLILSSCNTYKIKYCEEQLNIMLERKSLKNKGIKYSVVTKHDSIYGDYTYSETIFNQDGLATKKAFYFENGNIFLLDFYKYDDEKNLLKGINIDNLEHSKKIQTCDYSGKQEYKVDSIFSKDLLVEKVIYLENRNLVFNPKKLKYKDILFKTQNCVIDSIIRLDHDGVPTGQRRYFTYKNGNQISDILVKNEDTLEFNSYHFNSEGRNIGNFNRFITFEYTYSTRMVSEYKNDLPKKMTFISETEYNSVEKELDTTFNNIKYKTFIPQGSPLDKLEFPKDF